MTPITSHNGLKVVRHSSTEPSPFLVEAEPLLKSIVAACRTDNVIPRAVDIGCGAGRQSHFLEGLGFEVLAFDRKPDYGYPIELGERPLPVYSSVVNVVVMSYVLMFLDENALSKVISQCIGMTSYPSAIIIELADIKNGLRHGDDLVLLLDSIERATRVAGFGIAVRRKLHLLVAKGDPEAAVQGGRSVG